MNEIVNKFLLVGDKFMTEIHLKIYIQSLWTIQKDRIKKGKKKKSKERIQKLKIKQEI